MAGVATSAEVSRMLHISKSTVLRMARTGVLPVVQKLPGVTGLYLFDRDQIEAMGGDSE